ncbi:MAG: hypothetical protein QOK01_1619, partial [Alphaproteobacteria bacterium]|nr:hypothetical protein [Alphaproteobacteria bacterium]
MLAVLRNAIVGLGVRRIAAGTLVLIVSFVAALWALDVLFPRAASRPPKLAATAPLKAATRMSTVTAPIAVALAAIRDTMERQAPRDLAGKRDNPLAELLGKADIGWTLARGDKTSSAHRAAAKDTTSTSAPAAIRRTPSPTIALRKTASMWRLRR